MQKKLLSGLVAAAVLGIALPVAAQNLAIVNGKPVPKARAEALKQQVERSGRPITPEIEAQIKEEVIAREVFMQEAKKRNLEASAPSCVVPAETHPGNSGHQTAHSLVSESGSSTTLHFMVLDIYRTD